MQKQLASAWLLVFTKRKKKKGKTKQEWVFNPKLIYILFISYNKKKVPPLRQGICVLRRNENKKRRINLNWNSCNSQKEVLYTLFYRKHMRLYIWLGKQDVSDCVPLMVHTKSRKLSLKQHKKERGRYHLGTIHTTSQKSWYGRAIILKQLCYYMASDRSRMQQMNALQMEFLSACLTIPIVHSLPCTVNRPTCRTQCDWHHECVVL